MMTAWNGPADDAPRAREGRNLPSEMGRGELYPKRNNAQTGKESPIFRAN